MSNQETIARTIKALAKGQAAPNMEAELVRQLVRAIKGTCIRDDCGKYDESAPDNCSNAGVCIYHKGRGLEKTLRHVAAASGSIAEFKGACNKPCINTTCSGSVEGLCKAMAACELQIQPGPSPARACLEECINTDCPDWGAGDKCQAVELCSNRVASAPSHPEPCNEPCNNGECMNQTDGLCQNHGVCRDHYVDEPELLQGYTLDQWEQIRAGGYLCQFSTDGEIWKPHVSIVQEVRTLRSVPFVSGSGASWEYCRPAELPGVLRPWFGGECPVDPDVKVFARLRNSEPVITYSQSFDWGHGNPEYLATHDEIVSFMEVK